MNPASPIPPDESAWKAQPERSTAFWVGLLVWIAIHLGRGFTRLLLWPIALFFLLTGRAARIASRGYLRRVLGRQPRPGELLRHFYSFAACTVDRLLILCGRGRQLNVRVQLPAEVEQVVRGGGGCLMLVSHLGSFEVLRQLGQGGHDVPLRIVLDRSQGPLLTGLLERLNPQFAASVIDASKRGPELVLALREALDQGCSIGIMADRVHGGESSVEVQFLGASAGRAVDSGFGAARPGDCGFRHLSRRPRLRCLLRAGNGPHRHSAGAAPGGGPGAGTAVRGTSRATGARRSVQLVQLLSVLER